MAKTEKEMYCNDVVCMHLHLLYTQSGCEIVNKDKPC